MIAGTAGARRRGRAAGGAVGDGDLLDRLGAVVDVELVRPVPEAALARSDRSRSGRPACDPVPMPGRLVLQGLCSRSADAAGLRRRDLLPFLPFYGPDPADRAPHAPTIRLLGEPLARAAA
ncbi:hypothetical protein [Marinimicrococcus flavescens]|uniref:Transposase n=1 Tax=Marinimicrococcus flavescens TaxID=3031815 RepID=A0AAP3UYT2_9PROT|nr:hypothetical protein [Marinimicrococcus flavescens]